MNSSLNIVYRGTLIAVLLCIVAACGPNGKEKEVMAELSKSLETRCIGRFLIDLPKTFTISGEEVTLYYGLGKDFSTVDVQLIDSHSSLEKFSARVDKRASDISAEEMYKDQASMLVERRELDKNHTLLRYFDSALSDDSHNNEIHALVGSAHVLLKAESYEGVIAPVEARLLKLSSHLRPLPADMDKAGPGFCLGPVVIDADHDQEVASESYYDTRRQDLDFDIYMSAITPDSDESMADSAAKFLMQLAMAPKRLRQGDTQLGGMKAEELLLRYKDDGRDEHSFLITSQRDDPSFANPKISLQLTTGGQVGPIEPYDPLEYPVGSNRSYSGDVGKPSYVSSSLTDTEAIALWDSIIKSVRLRPGAVRSQGK